MQLNFSSHRPAIAKAALTCAFALLPGHAGAQVMAARSRSTITITATVSPRFEIATQPVRPGSSPAVLSTNAPSLRVTIVSLPIDRSRPEGRAPTQPRLFL